jgi:hypothetical protein
MIIQTAPYNLSWDETEPRIVVNSSASPSPTRQVTNLASIRVHSRFRFSAGSAVGASAALSRFRSAA